MAFLNCLLQHYTGHGQSINELKFHPRNCCLLLSVSKGVLRTGIMSAVHSQFLVLSLTALCTLVAVNSSGLE